MRRSGGRKRFDFDKLIMSPVAMAKAVAAAMLAQTGLISWLILEQCLRHTAELTARDAIAQLAQMNLLAEARLAINRQQLRCSCQPSPRGQAA